MLSPTIFFALVVGTIYAFQSFGQIDIFDPLPQPPGQSARQCLIYNVVNTLTQENNTGVAAVMSIALFVLTLLVTLLQMRFLESRVHYGR